MLSSPLLCPVILCGGDGTRLWPVSRKALPKPFIPLNGTTLFKKTLERASAIPNVSSPLILCNNDHRFLAASQAQEFFHETSKTLFENTPIVIEPAVRNTAPAIALAAFHFEKEDPLLLIMASDHELENYKDFCDAVSVGISAAEKGYLVTFGLVPSFAETAYGYIHKGTPIQQDSEALFVEKFVEKPNASLASEFVTSGEYLWNSGMFLFRASSFLRELKAFAPDIYLACKEAYTKRITETDFIRVDEKAFTSSPSDSIDYAVMEKTKNACVVPLDTKWSDLGSWHSLYNSAKPDSDGNVSLGDVVTCESSNNYILAQHRLVTTLGIHNMVVVETPDAVLVTNKEHSKELKKLVGMLSASNRNETDVHAKRHRPWGSYERLLLGDSFQVIRITVLPWQQLPLKQNVHSATYWITVTGVAHVYNSNKDFALNEGDSTYILAGEAHRLANQTEDLLEIIEIQIGSYFGEE